MINKRCPYPAYKPSGVPWLGNVPRHWETPRLKGYVTNAIDLTKAPTDGELYLALEHVESWTGRFSIASNGVSYSGQVKRFHAEDVLFGKLRPYLAKVTCPKLNGVCVGEFLVLRPHNANLWPRYLEQLLRSKPAIDTIDSSTFGAKMPRADWQFIGDLPFPLPPLPEQRAIVRYLDYVGRRIRRYLTAKRKLIALLEEEKQAVINQAVTRGLDPNLPLKPSGVGWLGEVPEHWEVRRLSQVSGILRGRFTHRPRNDPSLYDGPYPFIQTGEVAGANKMILRYRQTLNAKGLAVSTMFPGGTLVMTIAANIGDVAILSFDACFPDSVVGFVPSKSVYRDHLYYLFRAMKREFLREAPVNTQGNLNVDRIGSRKVAIPPLLEQADIVEYLEKAIADLDTALACARRQIELLQEYRTRLITDVVTGKLDVREAAAQLPDESDDQNLIQETDSSTHDSDEDFYAANNSEDKVPIEAPI